MKGADGHRCGIGGLNVSFRAKRGGFGVQMGTLRPLGLEIWGLNVSFRAKRGGFGVQMGRLRPLGLE